MVVGFVLVMGIGFTLPGRAFGAARSFGSRGGSRAPVMHRQNTFSHPFNRFGLFGGAHDVGSQQVIIIQQFPSPSANEVREPAKDEIYVPPRWVDGGHGVEILMPGHWAEPAKATAR